MPPSSKRLLSASDQSGSSSVDEGVVVPVPEPLPLPEPVAPPETPPEVTLPLVAVTGSGAAPFDDAFAFALSLLIDCAWMLAFDADLKLRPRFASALSLITSITNEPPPPALSPAAEASASRVLMMEFSALISIAPATLRNEFVILLPVSAIEHTPDTSSTSTGTTAVPPSAPAFAITVSSVSKFARTVKLSSSALSSAISRITPSAIVAMLSIPVTAIAMPAPTPMESPPSSSTAPPETAELDVTAPPVTPLGVLFLFVGVSSAASSSSSAPAASAIVAMRDLTTSAAISTSPPANTIEVPVTALSPPASTVAEFSAAST